MSSESPPPAGPVADRFTIAQGATLAVAASRPDQFERVARSLRPYPPGCGDGRPPDLLVTFLERPIAGEIVERLGDAGDGLHTSWDGRGLRLMHDHAGCRLLFGGAAAAVEVQLEPGFPWWRAFGGVVRPLLSIPLAANATAVAHASAVTLDGRGIAIAGWAESGKTEVALALCERGASFVSDKWTALAGDGTLHAMPVPAGLRAWTIPHLPQLRAELSRAQRTRAAGGRALANAVERFAGRGGGQAASAGLAAARRAAALASRVSLSPADIGRDGDEPQLCAALGLIVVLRSLDGEPAVRDLDRATARRRIATTTAYERRMLDELDARLRYCGADGIPGWAGMRAREEAILDEVLAGPRVVELTAPFPADPRPAADALIAFAATA